MKDVPLGAVPRTGAFPDGADLMFTPGRCKKRDSRLGVMALGATWGEALAVRETGTSGEGLALDAPRDGSRTAVEVSDDDCALVGEGGAGTSRAAWAEVADADCKAVSPGVFDPGEARNRKK